MIWVALGLLLWVGVLGLVWCWCIAAARADRLMARAMVENARERRQEIESRARIYGSGGWRS